MHKKANKNLIKTIGNNIRNKRKFLKITTEELAESVNLSSGYIRLIERGGRGGSIETLINIMDALDMDFNELIGKSIKEPPDLYLEKVYENIESLHDNDKQMILEFCSLLKQKNNSIKNN